jgi:hypothetical protein
MQDKFDSFIPPSVILVMKTKPSDEIKQLDRRTLMEKTMVEMIMETNAKERMVEQLMATVVRVQPS